jgi:hypothetical protein
LQIFVNGRYVAGAYRPPLTLKNGATLDLSGVEESWSAKGQAASSGNNNRTFQTPGLVTFENDAGITVDLGERKFVNGLTKVVDWASKPTASFELGSTKQKGLSLKVSADGLYVNAAPGLTIFVR